MVISAAGGRQSVVARRPPSTGHHACLPLYGSFGKLKLHCRTWYMPWVLLLL